MRKTLLVLALLVAGCASTGVVPADRGTYLLTKKSPQVGFGPPTAAKAEAYEEANAFCAAKGLAVETVRLEQTDSGLLRQAAVTLEFRCVQ